MIHMVLAGLARPYSLFLTTIDCIPKAKPPRCISLNHVLLLRMITKVQLKKHQSPAIKSPFLAALISMPSLNKETHSNKGFPLPFIN